MIYIVRLIVFDLCVSRRDNALSTRVSHPSARSAYLSVGLSQLNKSLTNKKTNTKTTMQSSHEH